MHEFSTIDGFVEITECLEEMIKYVANEPSVGLFYVQQHIQNAVPNLINLKDNVVEQSHEMTLHTEDLEDSITMVSSMKECGSAIAKEMIGDIKKSVAIMSATQPTRGLIKSPRLGFQIGRTSSWGPATRGSNADQEQDDGKGGYFSTILKTAKHKASNFKWLQLDSRETEVAMGKKPLSHPKLSLSVETATVSCNTPTTHTDELPLSSPIANEPLELEVDGSSSHYQPLLFPENYDEFKAKKEARLEEWLEGDSNKDDHLKVNSSGRELE